MQVNVDSELNTLFNGQPDSTGNLAGTASSGLIYLEYARLERKISGVWTSLADALPTTFQAVETEGRQRLETWTHKPLFSVWLPPSAGIKDADRLIRADGTRWYVRGAPLVSPTNTHVVALVEAAAEDGLFAARSASEPS